MFVSFVFFCVLVFFTSTTPKERGGSSLPKEGKQHHTKEGCECITTQGSTAKKGERESDNTHPKEAQEGSVTLQNEEGKRAPPTRERENHHFGLIYIASLWVWCNLTLWFREQHQPTRGWTQPPLGGAAFLSCVWVVLLFLPSFFVVALLSPLPLLWRCGFGWCCCHILLGWGCGAAFLLLGHVAFSSLLLFMVPSRPKWLQAKFVNKVLNHFVSKKYIQMLRRLFIPKTIGQH